MSEKKSTEQLRRESDELTGYILDAIRRAMYCPAIVSLIALSAIVLMLYFCLPSVRLALAQIG